MANVRMPEESSEAVAHHLPPEQPAGPQVGRPRIGRRVVRVLWFGRTTGARREDVPAEPGRSGRTAHRRPRAREEAGIWDRLHADLRGLLERASKLDYDTLIVDGVSVTAFGGGVAIGPSPVDRGQSATKYTRLGDRRDVPPAIRTAG